MSIQFNDTSAYKGLVQLYEREIGADRTYVSGDTERLKQFTADVNVAWDDFMYLASEASGTWQFDDSGHSKFPLIYTNLVSGQQDYTFLTDEEGSLILDIQKVGILPSATASSYVEIGQTDQQSQNQGNDIFEEVSTTGTPFEYDKTANGIFLNPAPNYNATKGIKMAINREASYFTSTDTTKKPGVPGNLHSWFYKKPAYEYAKIHLSPARVRDLGNDIEEMKKMIKDVFASREKDKRHIMTPKKTLYI